MRGFYEHCILPEPFTILGRELKPFGFGHYIILRRFGVGFVCDSTVPYTLEDLVFSIFICSYTYEEAEDLLYKRLAVPLCSQWGKALSKSLKGKDADLAAAAIEFNRYLAVHTITPEFTPTARPTFSAKLQETNEWYEDILSIVQKTKGYTQSQLFNYPYCRIQYEYLCEKKRTGDLRFGKQDVLFNARKEAYMKKQKELAVEQTAPKEEPNG